MASASDFPAKVKQEMDDDFDVTDGHSHTFTVQFEKKDEHTILCERPCTVLEAIQSNERMREEISCADENIVIKRGTGDDTCTIATHFPCSLIKKNESLRLIERKEIVERKTKEEYLLMYPQSEYVVFYVDKDFGVNAKKRQLFRSNVLKNYRYVCIYGVKGTTVKEALERDGRFVDDLGKFYLKNIENGNRTDCAVNVKVLDGKKFQICMEKMKRVDGKPWETPGAKGDGKLHENPGSSKPEVVGKSRVLAVAQAKPVSVVRTAKMADNDDIEEVLCMLRQQFPELREQMKKRFSQKSYEEVLELKKKNFGKIQQSFSEVYRVRELLKLSKSVCKIVVGTISCGTGFVLFDNLILTNKHLFDQVKPTDLGQINVYALFDYEKPEPKTDYCVFTWEAIIDSDQELDYAIIKLRPEGERSIPNSPKQTAIPPGLLKRFGPVPEKGEACIIGHPQGEVKKMDPTCVIEVEERIRAINRHLEQYDNMFIVQSVVQDLKIQGIESILTGGAQADKGAHYNTFMYHGSSGSPVFDYSCRVFGLHTSGFMYEFPRGREQHVIEYANSLLSIFKKFVSNVRNQNDETLLNRIFKEATGNDYLKAILSGPDPDHPEFMDTTS